jgi:hypothetical protein
LILEEINLDRIWVYATMRKATIGSIRNIFMIAHRNQLFIRFICIILLNYSFILSRQNHLKKILHTTRGMVTQEFEINSLLFEIPFDSILRGINTYVEISP